MKPRRIWPRVVLIIIALLLVGTAISAPLLYMSSRRILDGANKLRPETETLRQSLLDGDAQLAGTALEEFSSTVADMQKEFSSPLWLVASFVPVIGQDVTNARTLVACADDLAQNALAPFVTNIAGVPLSNLIQERSVNTSMLRSMRDTVVSISPAISEDARRIASLRPGRIDRINEVVDALGEPLATAGDLLGDADGLFSLALGLLGDGGQTRSYALLALTNSEARPAGGLPGSVCILEITDGAITLGSFHTIWEVVDLLKESDFKATISADEQSVLGSGFASFPSDCTLSPDFERCGEVVKEQWERAYGRPIDGVIALDPFFLQQVIALTGDITADDGTVITGENAAEELLNGVYWRYGYDKDGQRKEDDFFADVAQKSFEHTLDTMGNFGVESFATLGDIIKRSGAERHLQVWLADESQENFMRAYGISGSIQTDLDKPELGVYITDYTLSKICWYLDIDPVLGEPSKTADGSLAYPVTVHFRNSLTMGEAERAPRYITGDNTEKRDVSDIMERVYVMAPLQATISDYAVHMDEPAPSKDDANDVKSRLYDRETYVSDINVRAQGDTTITFTLTMPAGVDVAPSMVTTPPCHE